MNQELPPIIEIKGISKKYNIKHARGGYIALRDVITNTLKHPIVFLKEKVKRVIKIESREEFWALRDINLTVKKGEIIGIIGANGAGKSTLLKILTNITPPTSGEIVIRGKIASLLEVGTGFHPELTGRENIFLNGAILGMKKEEIEKKFNEIVKFAEVEKFIDTVVKHYSSGMYVRLAFSVAAHMEPDILLIDEVLAVGDASFQKKCLEKIQSVARKDNRTILFVSHNLDAVQNLCEKSIYLERGEIKMIGETGDVIKAYLNKQSLLDQKATIDIPAIPNKDFQIRKIVFKNSDGISETNLQIGKPFSVEVYYDVRKDNPIFWIHLQCTNEYGALVFISRDTDKNPLLLPGRKKGSYCSIFTLPSTYSLSLNSGRYLISIKIDQDPSSEIIVPIQLFDPMKKFNRYAGVILVGEPWKNNEQK